MQEQLTIDFDILLNPSVRTEDEKRLSRQCRKIVKWLADGFRPAPNTDDLSGIARNHTARISEIRTAVEPIGLDVLATDLGGGLYEYTFVDQWGHRQVGEWIISKLKERSGKPILWEK
jgi:hypothetical protein